MYSKASFISDSSYISLSHEKYKKLKKLNGDVKTERLSFLENYDSRNSPSRKQHVISKKMKASAMKKRKKNDSSDEEPPITLQMDYSDCEDDEEDEGKEENILNSDSDLMGEEEEEEEEESLQSIKRLKRPRKFLDFFDEVNLPPLEIPPSSVDLPIDKRHVMQTLGIYEVLRHFSRFLRLSVFRFEELCVALLSHEQSTLIAEIHISLLRYLLRADDAASFVFGPQDTKDSINIIFNNIDFVTWYETVRQYLTNFPDFPISLFDRTSYSQNSLEDRLQILQYLTDLSLTSAELRNDIINEISFVHEDQCRVCHKLGDLVCCELCPGVYHLECVGLSEVPEGDWVCKVCSQSQVEGVSDCAYELEKEGLLSRQYPIGYDRHARTYWFLSRRIFVESETDIWYYSTEEELNSLMEKLDPKLYEEHLCVLLEEMKPEIIRQMQLTKKLENNGEFSPSQLSLKQEMANEGDGDDEEDEDALDKMDVEEANKIEHDVSKVKTEDAELNKSVISRKSKSRTNASANKNKAQVESLSSPLTSSSAPTATRDGVVKSRVDHLIQFSRPFKHKQDSYVNSYTHNTQALSKQQHYDEKEKRRHLSYKFNIPMNTDFQWGGVILGGESTMVETLKNTILIFEANIPLCLAHPLWPEFRLKWVKMVQECSSVGDFSSCLSTLQYAFMSVVYNHVWNEALGHTHLRRTCLNDKEEVKRKRMRWDDNDYVRNASVKFALGVKHQLWKMRGEEYRLLGGGGWGWVRKGRLTNHKPASSSGLLQLARVIRRMVKKGIDEETKNEDGDNDVKITSVFPAASNQLTNGRIQTRGFKMRVRSRLKIEYKEFETDDEEDKVTNENTISLPNYKYKDLRKISINNDDDFDISLALLHNYNLCINHTNKLNDNDNDSDANKLKDTDNNSETLKDGLKSSDETIQEINDQKDKMNEIMEDVPEVKSNSHKYYHPHKQKYLCVLDALLERRQKQLESEIKIKEKLEEMVEKWEQKNSNVNDDCVEDGYVCYSCDCNSKDGSDGYEVYSCYSTLCNLNRKNKIEKVKNNLNEKTSLNENNITEDKTTDTSVTATPSNLIATSHTTTPIEAADLAMLIKNERLDKLLVFLIVNKIEPTRELLCDLQMRLFNVNKTYSRTSLPKNNSNKNAKNKLKNNDSNKDNNEDNDTKSNEGLSHKTDLNQHSNDKDTNVDTTAPSYEWKQITVPHKWRFKGVCSIFLIDRGVVLRLGRKGAKGEVDGFSYNCKMTNVNWPYPSPRPLFKTAWHYHTMTATSYSCIGAQLRVLWSVLRWDGLNAKAPSSFIHTVTQDNNITTTELLKRRHLTPDGMKSEFLVRKITIPLTITTTPKTQHGKYTSHRSGLRQRRKAEVASMKEPSVTEDWCADDAVELWQVMTFDAKMEKEKKEAEERLEKKKIAEERLMKASHKKSSRDAPQPILPSCIGPADDFANVSIVQAADGNYEIHGLNSNQQIIQLSNGNIHIATVSTLNAPLLQGDSSNSPPLTTYVLGPQIVISTVDSSMVLSQESDNTSPTPSTSINTKSILSSNQISYLSPQAITPSTSSHFALTPEVLQFAVNQALSQNKDPGVREKLVTMQKMVVQGRTPRSSIPRTSHPRRRVYVPPTSCKVVKAASSHSNLSQEEKDEMSRLQACGVVMRWMLEQIERGEKADKRAKERQDSRIKRLRGVAMVRLEGALMKKKDQLKREIINRRNLLTSQLTVVVQNKLAKKKEENKRVSTKKSKELTIKIPREVVQVTGQHLHGSSGKKHDVNIDNDDDDDEDDDVCVDDDDNGYLMNHHHSRKRKHSGYHAEQVRKKLRYEEDDDYEYDGGYGEYSGYDDEVGSEKDFIKKFKILKDKNGAVVTSVNGDDKKHKHKKQKQQHRHRKQRNQKRQKLYDESLEDYDDDEDDGDNGILDDQSSGGKKVDEELYCLCRTPYDDSKFYIACDVCQDWFHGSCVGVTKMEAEKLDTYSCPRCKQQSRRSSSTATDARPLREEEWMQVSKLIQLVKVHRSAWPFLNPVDPEQVSDYYNVIKDPMDLSTIENKVRSRRYTFLGEMVKDIMKVFDNCRYYNAKNTTFFKCADNLEIYVVSKLKSLKSKLNLT